MRLCVSIREKLAAPVSWCKSGAVCSLEVSQYNVLGAEILKISIYIDALSYIKVRVKERERAEHLRVCKRQRVIREKSLFRDGGRTSRIFQLKTHRRSWRTGKTSRFYLYIWLLGLANNDKLQELMTDRFVQARNNHCKTWYTLDNFKISTILNLVETTDQRHRQWQFQPTFNVMILQIHTAGETTPADCSIVLARWDFTETREIKCGNIVT